MTFCVHTRRPLRSIRQRQLQTTGNDEVDWRRNDFALLAWLLLLLCCRMVASVAATATTTIPSSGSFIFFFRVRSLLFLLLVRLLFAFYKIKAHCYKKNYLNFALHGRAKIDILIYLGYSAPFVSPYTCVVIQPTWSGSQIPPGIRLGVDIACPAKFPWVRWSMKADLTPDTRRPRTRHPARFLPFPLSPACRCSAPFLLS